MRTADSRFPSCILELFSNISDSVEIGTNCIIGSFVVIRPHVRIGNNSVIAHNCVIEPFTVIGNNTTVQVFSAFAQGTIIGDNCFFGSYFSSTNCKHVPKGEKGTSPKKLKAKLEPITISDDVIIGANCKFAPNVKVGKGTIIGMNCLILKDVGANQTIKAGTVWK